ncbi:hypothetical protein [Candidimonas nitroreducens]|jgi:hypothetical protein|uniref:Uncharacterized protein n=1 Tax=Candidimonas nitroreducens TaxID=683354 RepID=A0A225MWN0_9BURK|nr:hypothetical protein [Candidimonas nitroreducens]OWT65534.1 hypothetical protein CEY11_01970 [Candidimonas nitroreducens]
MNHDSRDRNGRQTEQQRHDQDFYSRLGLENPEPAAETPEDTILISIYCEHWTQEDLEAGQCSLNEVEVKRVAISTDELQRLAQDHGLDSPSASGPSHAPYLWFASTTPREDRAYFEQGVHKYYSLHVHEVNGHRPEPADYQRVSDLIGIRFDHPLKLQESTHEMEGPDLCS